MPYQKELIQVPLSTGLSQKLDSRILQASGAVQMQNCVALKSGAIRKRFGTLAITKTYAFGTFGTTGTIAAALAGGAYRGGSWMSDGLNFYNWSETSAAWELLSKHPEAQILDRMALGAITEQAFDFDWCLSGGYVVAVIVGGTSDISTNQKQPILMVADASALGGGANGPALLQGINAAVVVPIQNMTTNTERSVRLIPCTSAGNPLVIYLAIDGSGNLIARTITFASFSPAYSNPTTLIAAANLSANAKAGVFDAAPMTGDASRFVVAITNNTPNPTLHSFSSALVSGLTKVFVVADDPASICVQANTNAYWWIGWETLSTNFVTKVSFYNENTNTIGAITTVAAAAGATIQAGRMGIDTSGANQCGFVWGTGFSLGVTGVLNSFVNYTNVSDNAGTPQLNGTLRHTPGVQLASRPVYVSTASISTAYMACIVPSAVQGSIILMAADYWTTALSAATQGGGALFNAMRPIGYFAPRLIKQMLQTQDGSHTVPTFAKLAGVADGSATGLTYAFPLVPSTQTFHNALALQPSTFAPTQGLTAADVGELQLLSAAVNQIQDGHMLVEPGFLAYPEITATAQGAGGNLSAGSYSYIVVYECFDNRGNIHRSATSPAVTVTTVANDSVVVKVLNDYGLTLRRQLTLGPGSAANTTVSVVAAVIYRTTQGGTIYYRQTADPAPAANLCVNTAADILSITDTTSDANLTASATAQVLYTTGGNLDNMAPPGGRICVSHQQRWYVAGCDETKQIWASKALTTGEAPGFHETLAQLATGAVRGLASMDDKLIVFVQRGASFGIEYITGLGPLDTGQQSDWSPPQPVPSDSGAIDQRGVCTGPFGTLYRSPVGGPNGSGGIFVLSRDLQTRYISGPVEDLLNACPIVTSMVVHPNEGRVYITTITNDSSPATTNGATRLVWDYQMEPPVWSSDVLYDTDLAQNGLACRAAWVAVQTNTTLPTVQAPAYHCLSPSGRVYRETNGVGSGAYKDNGPQFASPQFVTMTYKSALLKVGLSTASRFWRVQLVADQLEAHDVTMQLLFDGAPSSYYQESNTWVQTSISTFDRFPQVDVEMLVGNQKAKSVQVVLSDATPTGGGATTGQGPSWAGLVVEIGVEQGRRYTNLPSAQRS